MLQKYAKLLFERLDCVNFAENLPDMKKPVFYLLFFAALIAGFFFWVFNDYDFTKSKLSIINESIPSFSFVNQDGNLITNKQVEGKVYVAEYFFTTCRGICPKMNANMRRVYETYKDEPNFMILSHTCMPEVDSVPVLKAHEFKMLQSKLIRKDDGTYSFADLMPGVPDSNKNWMFLTGPKKELYFMARKGYMIDNGKPDAYQNEEDEFIHTQFFALVDKAGRVRGIYDGLKNNEVDKMMQDIRGLLGERVKSVHFLGGFNNNPS
jgi:protein SCO1/2